MSSRIKSYLPAGIAGILFLALAAVFGKYDLSISTAIVNENSVFGRMLEALGLLVAPLLFSLSGAAVAVFFIKETCAPRRTLKIVLSCTAALAGIVYTLYTCASFSTWLLLIGAPVLLLLFAAAVFLFVKLPRSTLYRLMKIAAVSLFYLFAILILISVIKVFWGRIRFRQLTDLAQFTPWYLPQGVTGFVSFPSGHTANATALWILTMFAPLVKTRFKKALCFIVPSVWIVLMAFSRVLVGAHYASDVLFGAAISIAVFYAVRHFVSPRIRPLKEK